MRWSGFGSICEMLTFGFDSKPRRVCSAAYRVRSGFGPGDSGCVPPSFRLVSPSFRLVSASWF